MSGPLTVMAVLLLALVALHDLALRTIPDSASLGLLGCGLALRLGDGQAGQALALVALLALPALLLWRLGWIGGGDAKLLPAIAPLAAPEALPDLLLAIAVAGGLLALPYLLARRRLALPARPPTTLSARLWRAECRRLRRGGPLPYAVAIAAGALLPLLDPNGMLP
ncbi:prepilin peptidase [Roseomonas sp. 18066]|uniref:A24 family peptidase n=1 Tax=Roseomonas sp. 18066 TaxID=2681412 RepID=UPI0013577EF9|nr:prepilin peptidase [Roseomonas sp. 18066]